MSGEEKEESIVSWLASQSVKGTRNNKYWYEKVKSVYKQMSSLAIDYELVARATCKRVVVRYKGDGFGLMSVKCILAIDSAIKANQGYGVSVQDIHKLSLGVWKVDNLGKKIKELRETGYIEYYAQGIPKRYILTGQGSQVARDYKVYLRQCLDELEEVKRSM